MYFALKVSTIIVRRYLSLKTLNQPKCSNTGDSKIISYSVIRTVKIQYL